MNERIKGIGASQGIALAKVLVLKEDELKVSKKKIKDENIEIQNYENAINLSLKELNKLQKITLKKLGEEKAAIFEAHKEIVLDPEIKSEIINMIKRDKVNSDFAIKTVTDRYIKMFEEMDDPYFKERSADIKDISNRLIKHVLGLKIIDLTTISEEVIIVAQDLTPSQTAQLDRKYVKGFATNIGGRTSHAAIMARSLEIPAVLGLKNITNKVSENELISLNGNEGFVTINLSLESQEKIQKEVENFNSIQEELKKFKDKKSLTKDGVSKLIEGNIGALNDVKGVIERGGDGVGLFRTEFLYMDNDHFPTEEEQFNAYKEVVESVNKVVIIRTLDIGGDKKLSYFKFPEEMNPFLGYRAIRFTLSNKDIFRDQIRALLRASIFGKLGIMFPMVATVEEFVDAKNFVEECKKELDKEKILYDKEIEIGMMIEIPSAAVMADQFAKYSDFFSIGTNDLVQYSMAADRMSENVSYLYQPTNPAILRLIKMTIDGGHKYKR